MTGRVFGGGAAFEERVGVGVEQAALARDEAEALVAAAFVDQPEQRQQPRPGAVAPVHQVADAGRHPPGAWRTGRAARSAARRPGPGHQVPVLGVEDEDEAHQRGDEAAVDLLRVAARPGPGAGARGRAHRRRRSRAAARRASPAPAGRAWSRRCSAPRGWPPSSAGRRSRVGAEQAVLAQQQVQGARIGRPMTVAMSATRNVRWPEVSPLGAWTRRMASRRAQAGRSGSRSGAGAARSEPAAARSSRRRAPAAGRRGRCRRARGGSGAACRRRGRDREARLEGDAELGQADVQLGRPARRDRPPASRGSR